VFVLSVFRRFERFSALSAHGSINRWLRRQQMRRVDKLNLFGELDVQSLVPQPSTHIVLTFDRLPATLLSCYGNEWIETQNFDRLASRSSVFEEHYVEIPGRAGPNHPWWTGQYEFFTNEPPGVQSAPGVEASSQDLNGLIRRLQDSGVACHFVSERADELPALENASFEIVSGSSGLDANHTDSHFAHLIDRGIELLRGNEPQLIWLHSEGVRSPWLPSRVFAELYLDELEDADETGPEIARILLEQLANDETLAHLLLSEDPGDFDAKAQLSELGPFAEAVSQYLFAGFVSQLDHILARLLNAIDAIEDASDRNVCFVLTSASGQSFSERDAFVSKDELKGLALTEQALLTPLIIRGAPNESAFGHRVRGIHQPVDLLNILEQTGVCADSTGKSPSEGSEIRARSEALHFGAQGEVGIRDSEWFFTASSRAWLKEFNLATDIEFDESAGFLFVKPDDFHDINNVLFQEPVQAERLIGILKSRIPD
jgi:hypothetical protein